MAAVKLVAIFVKNKPGQTARVTGVLAAAQINIRWVTIVSTGPFGVMKFLVDRPGEALQALKRQAFVTALRDVLAVEVEDAPGALHAVAECLAGEGINLETTSGFVAGQRAVLLLELQDVDRAQAALQAGGFRLLADEDLLRPTQSAPPAQPV